jgi:outer membrane protein OmpA-like peptidoglycan-associated protein
MLFIVVKQHRYTKHLRTQHFIMKFFRTNIAVFSVAVASLCILCAGCNPLTRTQRGAAIGVGAGGTVGALIGKTAGNTALGIIIGGAIGGTAGAFIGRNMDNQVADIKRTVPGAIVTREDDKIVVRFDSGILFDPDKADLKPEARENLQNLALSLKNHPENDIAVIGHTDSTGTVNQNIELSAGRAGAVKSFLITTGISSSRLIAEGKGEQDPVATNATPKGRAQNRRVEIVIMEGTAKTQQDTTGH